MRLIPTFILILILSPFSHGQLLGPLSGVITSGDYTIVGEISVDEGDSLVIEPGTVFDFLGHYSFIINGYLCAMGSESDSIKFISSSETVHWNGIRVVNTSPDTIDFKYCYISCGYATEGCGGGMYVENSNISLENCFFENNEAIVKGGGLYCYRSYIFCKYDRFASNNSHQFGGGICCEESDVRIENCISSENSALLGSAAYLHSNMDVTITESEFSMNQGGKAVAVYNSDFIMVNCTIEMNFSVGMRCAFATGLIMNSSFIKNESCGVCFDSSNITLRNCTVDSNMIRGVCIYNSNVCVCNNIISNSELGGIYFDTGEEFNSQIMFNNLFNNRGGDFEGSIIPSELGNLISVNVNGDSCDIYYNIYADPMYYSYTGDSAYYLTESSPCIDAGDPSSPLDPDSTIADMGAYYYDQGLWVKPITENLPQDYGINAYPNPFNQQTAISYKLQVAGYMELAVYDISGREVAKLVDGYQNAGSHEVIFDAKELVSGVYFIRLTVDDAQSMVRKMVLMK